MTILANARWPEIDTANRAVLIVPVGSLEQHGPHLPLDTDAFLAQEVAKRLHHARPDGGLSPVLPIGASGEHRHFPGTLSIGTTALRDVLVELVRHASTHWGAVLVINGHGGNADALKAAADICDHERRRLAVTHLAHPSTDAHAGRAETAMMLHLAPTRVRLDLAEVGVRTPLAELMPDLVRRGVRALSPNGVLGDPTGASADEGRRLVGRLVASAIAAYDQCLSAA